MKSIETGIDIFELRSPGHRLGRGLFDGEHPFLLEAKKGVGTYPNPGSR